MPRPCHCGAVADAPSATAAGPTTWNNLQCGDKATRVLFDDEGALLAAGPARIALLRARSASGARCEAQGDSGTRLWNKGAATMLSLRGQAWPECREVAAPPFSALGHAPGWLLNINGAAARLSLGMGAGPITAALPAPRVTRTTLSYNAASSAGAMTIVITDQRCIDSISRLPHPASVQVAVRGQVYKGCGGDPLTLLTAAEWRVDSLAGAPTAEGSRIALLFGADGTLTGQAGCNRCNTRFKLDGDGLKIDPPAATRMACAPPLMAQEVRVFELLAGVQGFDIGADGALLLRTAGGQTIVARQP